MFKAGNLIEMALVIKRECLGAGGTLINGKDFHFISLAIMAASLRPCNMQAPAVSR